VVDICLNDIIQNGKNETSIQALFQKQLNFLRLTKAADRCLPEKRRWYINGTEETRGWLGASFFRV